MHTFGVIRKKGKRVIDRGRMKREGREKGVGKKGRCNQNASCCYLFVNIKGKKGKRVKGDAA